MAYFFVILLGLCLGSFYNVCISRIPKDESIIGKRSHCPKCKKTIPVYDLIPVISFLMLRGKCRFCRKSISIRYPVVEILTTGLLLFLVYMYGISLQALIYFIFSSILLLIGFIDMENLVIPDIFMITGIVIAVFYIGYINKEYMLVFTGMISGFLFMFLLSVGGKWLFKKEALGDGDIKMAVMVGAFLGMKKLILSVFLASFIGLAIAIFLLVLRKFKREDYLPFGSFLSISAFIVLLYGEQMLNYFFSF